MGGLTDLLTAEQFYVPVQPLPQSMTKTGPCSSVGTMAICSLIQDNGAIGLLGFHGFQMIGLFGKQLVCVGLKVTVEGELARESLISMKGFILG